MQCKAYPFVMILILFASVAAAGATGVQTQPGTAKHHVLYSFTGGSDGSTPAGGLVLDAAGNIYGTTQTGGSACKNSRCGVVFELSRQAGNSWTEKVLYNFSGGPDGGGPSGSLVFDAAGNLYGTGQVGGPNYYGIVYQLAPQAGGGWVENILHSFQLGAGDGYQPVSGVIKDAAGNLYGTTIAGGAAGYGTVFELMPGANNSWSESILYSIAGGSDGSSPTAGVTFDAKGNLYSAAGGGNDANFGTVFQLSPQAGGTWKETVLYAFGRKGRLGAGPNDLVVDSAGNLYGTTSYGGAHNSQGGYGAVFELTPKKSGGWKDTLLHSFDLKGDDGYRPVGALISDAAGNLYGVTEEGGSHNKGMVFKLTQTHPGEWTETVLYNFRGSADGAHPGAGLTMNSAGHLLGTTQAGGKGFGVVFEIIP